MLAGEIRVHSTRKPKKLPLFQPIRGTDLLNFDRDFSPQGSCRIVQCQVSERSLEHRQRDVYETHKHRAYAVAYYMVGNEIEAEEVAQDTFIRAFRQADEPDGRCVDCALVEELRDRMPLDEQAAPAEPVPTQSLDGRNIKRTDLEEAVKQLPPNERMVFLLRDVEGYDADRVAALLEIPRQQVERTLLSARIRMRTALAAMKRPAAAA
jgi:RNA polymerase sigma-70 factor (ECF subfamily)